MDKGTCSDPSCARPAHSRGVCTLHYARARKSGQLPLIKPHRPHRSRAGGCEIDGCDRPIHAQGLCGTHDSVRRRNGDPTHYRRAAHAAKYHARDGLKVCTRCQERKPTSEFFANKQTPDQLLPRCKKCSMELERQDRAARPEVWRSRRRDYYVANADIQRQNRKDWYQANRDRALEYYAEYHRKNRDRRREYDQTRRDVRAEQCKSWLTPERARNFAATRRARQVAATIGDPRETVEYIAVLDSDPCSYCGRPSEAADHIQPIVSGGAHAWWNLTAACTSCNSQKGARELLDFLLLRLPA